MATAKPLKINFLQEKEAGYRRVFSRSPLLTNLTIGWQGVYFAYDYQPPGGIPEVVANLHGVAIFIEVPSPIQVERTLGSRFQLDRVVQGDIVVNPANMGTRAKWDAAAGVIYLGFEPSSFAHAMYEMLDPDRVELLPHFATADPLVYQIGLALKAVLETPGSGSRLYSETMANALIVHLLQHYSAQLPSWREYTDGLPRHKLRQVIDYIQAHLERDLGLEELAAVGQMSSHYFCQQFKRSTGITPHQYVIRCRVERAKDLLLQGWAIADAARSVGFVDQSHLTRHFKRLIGVTPKTLRQTSK